MEAKRATLENERFQFPKSFASVVKTTQTKAGQTELTWVKGEKPQPIAVIKDPRQVKAKNATTQSLPIASLTTLTTTETLKTIENPDNHTKSKKPSIVKQYNKTPEENTATEQQDTEMMEEGHRRNRSISPKNKSRIKPPNRKTNEKNNAMELSRS